MPGLNIALYSNSIVMGGMESHIHTLAAGLQHRTWQDGAVKVFVILPEAREIDLLDQSLAQAGIRTHRLTLIGDQPGNVRLQKISQLVRLLKEEKADVFHQHRTGPFHGKWAILAARLAGTPVALATEHSAPDQPVGLSKRLVNRLADRLLDRLIVVSDENRKRQVQIAGRQDDLLTVVHNGIDLQRFEQVEPRMRKSLRQSLELPEAAYVLGFVGRLHPVKGAVDFLQALVVLAPRYPDVYGVVVGEGPQDDDLRQKAKVEGIESRVRFMGFRNDVPQILQALDVFILPSLDEPFGLVVAEAGAAGLPVVATRVGGVPEIIKDGITGILIPPHSPDEIVCAVEELIQRPDLARSLADAGRKRAEESFSQEVMVEKTLAVYREAIARRNLRISRVFREGVSA